MHKDYRKQNIIQTKMNCYDSDLEAEALKL